MTRVIVDYTRLHDPLITLRLEREGDHWIVVDAGDNDTVYLRDHRLLDTVRWMRRMALTEERVQIDERSVTRELDIAGAAAVAWARAQAATLGEDAIHQHLRSAPERV